MKRVILLTTLLSLAIFSFCVITISIVIGDAKNDIEALPDVTSESTYQSQLEIIESTKIEENTTYTSSRQYDDNSEEETTETTTFETTFNIEETSTESVPETTLPIETTIETLPVETTTISEKIIYNTFSPEELDLLFRVVEAEIGIGNFENKCNVASVIFNRLYSGQFGTNLSEVLNANQFATIKSGVYLQVTVSSETIGACEHVFQNGDTTGNALFFDSTGGNSWAANNREYLFTDSAGHDFYR